MEDFIYMILPYLTGGAGGTIITIFYNKLKNKLQIMECHYVKDDIISKIPTIIESEEVNNIFSKQFVLKNTTNADHKSFKIIFEFDPTARIIRHTNTSKSGIDKLKKKLLKPNEYSATIRNFNRKDEVKFIFQIANIDKDEIWLFRFYLCH